MVVRLFYYFDVWGVGVGIGDINGNGDVGSWIFLVLINSYMVKMKVGRIKGR